MNQLSSNPQEAAAIAEAEMRATQTEQHAIAPPRSIRVYQMPDNSMHPRIRQGEFALLEECRDISDELDEEVLVQLGDGKWQLRTVQACSARTVTLSAYNPPSPLKVRRCDIAAIYRVEMIVPPETFAYMTDQLVHWAVRDANGNEYGTFPTHAEAIAFGDVVAERLDLDEMRYCRVVVSSDRAQAEVTQ
ncbi:hypothetical protein [Paraburkholderia gardini]|uniref:hypothetical protein n=1 Tax=Paraburkholderia gardini TaxID=2823469 RepID=UPI001D90E0C8|nr:hypothetical protein [Paraburkholderia gardini]CAG4891489.1 hypothetical protein R69919_01192 [Paraburkholderia gardini]